MCRTRATESDSESMKAIFYICVAGFITGCAPNQTSVSRWNEMWVDIALRHKYEKYSCARALEGYSKDPPAFSHRKRVTLAREQVLVKAPGTDLEAREKRAQRAEGSVCALSAKIDVLGDALKTIVVTTEQNQD